MPSALATFMLTTSSNEVGCSTGMSAGLMPLCTLSTRSAERRCWSSSEVPYENRAPLFRPDGA